MKEHLIESEFVATPNLDVSLFTVNSLRRYAKGSVQFSPLKSMQRKNKKITIGILGYGNMGQAIVARLRTRPTFRAKAAIMVHSRGLQSARSVAVLSSAAELLARSRVLFVCVKPQDFYEFTPFSRLESEHLIVVSIMAGVRIAHIQRIFPGAKAVRTMPNLPIQIGQGVIGWYHKAGVLASTERALLEKMFSTFGFGMKLANERMLDALTAASGSGPAYVFLFASALIKAARQLGFSKTTAERIVSQTIIGSLAYRAFHRHSDFNVLIQKVRSKKGATEAALNALGVAKYYKQWERAIARAYRRAKEISSYDIT